MEKYQSFEFTGYVYKKKKSKWGMELYLKSSKDDSAEKYPQHILVNVSTRNLDKVDPNLSENDKVKCVIVPTLNEGVSEKTERAYAINKLNLVSCDVLERAPIGEAAQSAPPEDIPF